jgi:hypothetical protein
MGTAASAKERSWHATPATSGRPSPSRGRRPRELPFPDDEDDEYAYDDEYDYDDEDDDGRRRCPPDEVLAAITTGHPSGRLRKAA